MIIVIVRTKEMTTIIAVKVMQTPTTTTKEMTAIIAIKLMQTPTTTTKAQRMEILQTARS
jgi:hypothetical protein